MKKINPEEYLNCSRTRDILIKEIGIHYGSDWEIIPLIIARGISGKIYYVTDKNNNKSFILKYIENGDIMKELELQNIASSINNISPRIVDYWLCSQNSNNGIIIMEKVGNLTLSEYLNRLNQQTNNDLISFYKTIQLIRIVYLLILKVYALNREGIFHRDLHFDNILVSLDEENIENLNVKNIYIIDFGKSVYWDYMLSPLYENPDNNIETLVEYSNKIQSVFKQLYGDRTMTLEFLNEQINTPTTNPNLKSILKLINKLFVTELFGSQMETLSKLSWDLGTIEEFKDYLDDMIKFDVEEYIENNINQYINNDNDIANNLTNDLMDKIFTI